MQLLLLAFEPVGSLRMDPSHQVAAALTEKLRRNGFQVEAALIPGSFSRCGQEAQKHIRRVRPDMVVALAQRGSCEGIVFERQAKNHIDAEIPDREGAQPRQTPIVPGGQATCETALPVEQMAKAVLREGIPAGISHDAGAFVCNALYYYLLLAEKKENFHGLFVHLPYLPGQDVRRRKKGMVFDRMVRGLEAAISVLESPNFQKAEKAP